MALFTGNMIGVDMGTCVTRIYLDGAGIALREATNVLALEEDVSSIIAIGDDAARMMGRTDEKTALLYPVMDGAVADINMAALLMVALTEKAAGRRRLFEKAQLFMTEPQGLTRVERDALEEMAKRTGTRRPGFVLSPLAAALGAGMDPQETKGTMVIILGGGLTEVAVLNRNGIVAARSIRAGSFDMDEAIVRYMRRNKQLIIGERTAEKLKRDIGTAELPGEENGEQDSVLVKGRDALTCKPKTVTVTPKDIALAIHENVLILVDTMRDAISRTPVSLAGDIQEKGVILSGGGALLRGLANLLSTMTGVPVMVSSHPDDDAILGLGVLGENPGLVNRCIQAGSIEM